MVFTSFDSGARQAAPSCHPPFPPPGAPLTGSMLRLPPLQIKEVGSGNFGVTWVAKEKKTGETVAIKFLER